MKLEADDVQALRDAVDILENPGFAMQITHLIGKPIEHAVDNLPASISRRIGEASRSALQSSLSVAVSTMNNDRALRPSNTMHKVLTTLSGGVGGVFGLPALAIELPVSTTIMLRSIADIARSEGENVRVADSQMACLEVFALGGHSQSDDGAETGYYATRAALAKAVSEAAKYVAEKGLAAKGAPAIARLISNVAARFSVPVSGKFAAQAVPAIGGAGGAAINLVFINHFQDMARGHFTVRRLERRYGAEVIQRIYKEMSRGDPRSSEA